MMFYFVSDKSDRDIQEGFLRVMQKNVATKTFSTRRSSTGVDKRNGKKFCKSLRVMVICKFNKYVYEAKKCCNKNYWESFKCKFNKYIYEAKKCWTCKLQSKF